MVVAFKTSSVSEYHTPPEYRREIISPIGRYINYYIFLYSNDVLDYMQKSIKTIEIVFPIDEYIAKTHTGPGELFKGFENNRE